jgi:ABC-type Fe3+ transport system permease subunit
MRVGELSQRSGFQFEIIKLNLLANAALIAFAIGQGDRWRCSLIACPAISFTLFLLWFHHAMVIRINHGIEQVSPGPEPQGTRTDRLLRIASFTISMLMNFVVIPLVAMCVYSIKTKDWLMVSGWICLALIVASFGYWIWFQYFRQDEKTAEPLPGGDA